MNCATCQKPFPINPPNHCGGSGFAITNEGKKICYDCAYEREVQELKDRSKSFVAYLGKDYITTWTGKNLMRVTESRPCRLTRRSNFHDNKSFRSIHAVDIHGKHWAGRGSEGVCIKLRPVKG
jgi:hypothetical protein